MKKELCKPQESSDLDNTRQVHLKDGRKTLKTLHQRLCLVDNQDAVRALSWLVSNCENVKNAWMEIERAFEIYSSPNSEVCNTPHKPKA